MMPSPITSEPVVAPRKRRLVTRPGSTSGVLTRSSTRTNPSSASAASTPRTTVAASTPVRPCVSAETSRVSAATSRTSPGTSMRRGCGGRRLGQPAQRREQQHEGQHRDRGVRLAPARPDVEGGREDRARRRCRDRRWPPTPTSRARAPDRAPCGRPAGPDRRPGRRRRRRPPAPARPRTAAAPARGRRAARRRPASPARRRTHDGGRTCRRGRRRRAGPPASPTLIELRIQARAAAPAPRSAAVAGTEAIGVT